MRARHAGGAVCDARREGRGEDLGRHHGPVVPRHQDRRRGPAYCRLPGLGVGSGPFQLHGPRQVIASENASDCCRECTESEVRTPAFGVASSLAVSISSSVLSKDDAPQSAHQSESAASLDPQNCDPNSGLAQIRRL